MIKIKTNMKLFRIDGVRKAKARFLKNVVG